MEKSKAPGFKISSIEIDLGAKRTVSCHPGSGQIKDKESASKMTNDEIIDLITQAKGLGATEVILVNNETVEELEKTHIVEFIKKQELFLSEFKPVTTTKIECHKHQFSCFVKNDGGVYPCIGLPLELGNIREEKLEDILSKSEVLENLRVHTLKIKGPCRHCASFNHCFGCRGRAHLITNDYLASDPRCPKNKDVANQIFKLPLPVDDFIPQKGKMKMISTLVEVKERYAKVLAVMDEKNPFVGQGNRIEDVAFMEIMAQSAAAMNGFELLDTRSRDMGGMLIGGQKITSYANAYAGDQLDVEAFKTTRFGNFGVVKAVIKRGQTLIADGEIKIYKHQEPE